MGFAYLKTAHGVLSCIQIFLIGAALLAGYFLWNPETQELNWLFFSAVRPLISLVLVILTVLWFTLLAILAQQVFVKDLLEQWGKAKLLVFHAVSIVAVLASAVIESYYLSKIASDSYYMARLIIVTVSCWLLLLTFIGQFVFVLLQ